MTPSLGSAAIIVSINDEEGLLIRHGSKPGLVLASLPADKCDRATWNKIWEMLDGLGVVRQDI